MVPNLTNLNIVAGQPVRATELQALHNNTLRRFAINSPYTRRCNYYGWKSIYTARDIYTDFLTVFDSGTRTRVPFPHNCLF